MLAIQSFAAFHTSATCRLRAVIYQLFSLCAMMTMLSTVGSVCCGQQPAGTVVTNISAPPVPGAGHDYIKMLNETVSPGSGSVNLRIDIPTPEGRGLTFPFSLTYNSNQALILQQSPNGGLIWAPQAVSGIAVGGWSLSLPQLSDSTSSYTLDPQDQANGDGSSTCYMVSGFVFTDLNGVSHSLGNLAYIYNNYALHVNYPSVDSDLDTACTAASSAANFSVVAFDSVVQTGSNQFTISSGYYDPIYQASLTQVPADQTSLPENNPPPPPPGSAGGIPVVAGPDGTVYTFSNGAPNCQNSYPTCSFWPSTIEDRNGNIISLNQRTGEIVDTAGRRVISISGGFPSQTTTTVTGADRQTYTLTWGTWNYSGYSVAATTLNPGSNCSNITSIVTGPESEQVITKITSPNGKFYTLTYDPTYGTLQQITYPNGGYAKYSYAIEPDYGNVVAAVGEGSCSYEVERVMVVSRQAGFTDSSGNDQSPIETQAFSYTNTLNNAPAATTVTTTDNLRNVSFTTIDNYADAGTGDIAAPVETSIVYKDSSGTTLKTVTKSWADQYSLDCEVETIGSSGASRGTLYRYVQGNILIDKKEYDYGQITSSACGSNGYGSPTVPSGTPARETHYELQSFGATNYSTASLLDRPCKVVVDDSSGNPAAETDVYYDGGSSLCGSPGTPSTTAVNNLPANTHDDANLNGASALYDTSSTTSRGNITSITKKCFACTDATTQYAYDETGEATQITDPNGNVTAISHTDNPVGSVNTNAYVTKIDPPHVNSVSHATTFSYNYITGNVLTVTDPNSQTTTYTYSDPLNRLTEVSYPDGGETGYCYSDVGGTYPGGSGNCLNSSQFQVFAGTLETAAQAATSYTTYDGLGRAIETGMLSAPGGTIVTDTTYDGLGQAMSITNPYQGSSSTGSVSYNYDTLGRKISETQQDSSTLLWCYDGIGNAAWSNCPSNQSSATNATWVNSQDEAGHTMQHVSDGLGRLAAVMEQQPSGTSLALETDYTYNALDDLLFVNQKGTSGDTARSRSFVYDSLSRLDSSTNPETGTIHYSYLTTNSTLCSGDPSLPCSKTNARSVSTYYSYDSLNRPITTSYSDGTPGSNYLYDILYVNGLSCSSTAPGAFAQCNLVGRLSYVSKSDNSTDAVYGYDAMGRVNMNTTCLFVQCPGYNSYDPREFAYDLAGHVTDIWYPRDVGNTQPHVQQTWDTAGRLSKVYTTDSGSEYDYLQSATYYPSGQVSSMSYGNGVVESEAINNRLQTTGITATNALAPLNNPNTGASGLPGFGFMSRGFSYSPSDGLSGGCSGSANNGNIFKITDSLNPTIWNRQFQYDCLDRLTGAQIGSNLTNYAIDSFGNMSPISGGSSTYTFDSATNRISNLPWCDMYAIPYDAAGNQQCGIDPYGGLRFYTYDAEERQTAITVGGSTTPFTTFTYSPEGERIQKTDADGTTTQYQYGNGGLLSERDQNGNWTDYIYANGAKIAAHHSNDVALHLHATSTGSGSVASYFLNGPSDYTVKAGDVLVWRQYQSGAGATGGPPDMYFWNLGDYWGNDTDGQWIGAGSASNVWQQRAFDLSPKAGGVFQAFRIEVRTTATSGDYDLWVADMAIVSSDGSVVPITTRGNPAGSSTFYTSNSATNVGLTVDTAAPADTTGQLGSTYFLGDNVGSTQYEVASGGWPVYQGELDAWGQELPTPYVNTQWGPFGGPYPNGQQYAPESFKFTGKERDSETGNDYFGARYYTSGIGRFMSPDWSAKVEPIPYSKLSDPQSLNLYAYVGNNPISGVDADGHDQIPLNVSRIGNCGISEYMCSLEDGSRNNAVNTKVQNQQTQQTQQQAQHANTLAPIAPLIFGLESGAVSAFLAEVGQTVLPVLDVAAPAILLLSSQSTASEEQDKPKPLPDRLVGIQGPKSGPQGNRHNSDQLDPAHGGTGDAATDHGVLTGGTSAPAPATAGYPAGTVVGSNGVALRPQTGRKGPRIDIPANGTKPHETLHYPLQ